jgi:hypothetical protein
MLGCHYLVCGPSEKVHRHYTIANCMRPDFYRALISGDPIDLSDDDQNHLCLTIKNYGIGLSKTFE